MQKQEHVIVIEGKNLDLTQAIKDYAEEKVNRIFKHFDSLIKNHEIRVVLSVLRNPSIAKNQRAEITINIKGGHVIRSEESETTVYASIDLAVDRIEKQLRKHKSRVYGRMHHGKPVKEFGIDSDFELENLEVSDEMRKHAKEYKSPEIIKTKRFEMESIEPEIAIGKLSDCGHAFYMFHNIFTNRIACVYERDDGGYGLIEPAYMQVAL